MIYFILFLEFFKTGLFSIGGGLATVPFLAELGEKYGWYTTEKLADMIAVAESTPGPIGINVATYAGYNAAGVLGAIIATLSLVLPSVIVIGIIAKCLQKFKESFVVESAFYGLRSATVGLIAAAIFGIVLMSLFDGAVPGIDTLNITAVALLAACIAITAIFKKLHPIAIVAIGAVAGVVLKL
ncbi:MAG: chromate transporter [Clostridia bacterium]|nr:chromate transporter [Clostridia bacterium]